MLIDYYFTFYLISQIYLQSCDDVLKQAEHGHDESFNEENENCWRRLVIIKC